MSAIEWTNVTVCGMTDPTELHDPRAYQGPELDDDGASRDHESLARLAQAQARRRAAQRDRRLDTWSARDGWAWRSSRG